MNRIVLLVIAFKYPIHAEDVHRKND